ncbi:SH3 domain-containing protein [Streptomyces sp. NBC_01190]|uniref:SH3 domain-containing protein n=1 Tax=Streptomyces sp. NBC_01190 TaxID=2903767 RepID=UPI00386E1718|nr:SH3 domain-containing protein [Streptomyces sp. NBC_01190]
MKAAVHIVGAVALAGGIVFGTVSPASADTAKYQVLEAVNVRATATKSSTALGVIPKGTIITINDSAPVAGGTYTACGVTEAIWYRTTWHGASGYVVASCLEYAG